MADWNSWVVKNLKWLKPLKSNGIRNTKHCDMMEKGMKTKLLNNKIKLELYTQKKQKEHEDRENKIMKKRQSKKIIMHDM